MATGGPYLFFDPHDNTVLAYILKMVQDRVIVTTAMVTAMLLISARYQLYCQGYSYAVGPKYTNCMVEVTLKSNLSFRKWSHL